MRIRRMYIRISQCSNVNTRTNNRLDLHNVRIRELDLSTLVLMTFRKQRRSASLYSNMASSRLIKEAKNGNSLFKKIIAFPKHSNTALYYCPGTKSMRKFLQKLSVTRDACSCKKKM